MCCSAFRELPRGPRDLAGPKSAVDGTWKPDPAALGAFFTALARRYSGSFGGLPRVRNYQVWNEPNLTDYLAPQWRGKRQAAAPHYKRMLAASFQGVKDVSQGNRIVVSGLAPYGDPRGKERTRPLQFWRSVLCLRSRKRLVKAKHCGARARFDVFAHHAINTTGPPGQSALHPDDASSGDLLAVARVLRAAERADTVVGGRHPLWVTEFWWESDPPSRAGLPLAKQARYTAQTLFLAWKAGFSRAIQLRIRDGSKALAGKGIRVGDGLFFESGKPKPSARAFRFPFVADREGKTRKVLLWGKAPQSGRVVVQRKSGKRWKTIERLSAGRSRIFFGRTRLNRGASLRARISNQSSLVWRLR